MFSILTWYSLENSTTGLSLQYLSSTYQMCIRDREMLRRAWEKR